MKIGTSRLSAFALFIAVASAALFGVDSRSAKVNPPNGGQTGYRWTSVGPSPPAIPAAIASYPASRTIYIGSIGGGVLKSTNGGETWQSASNGLGETQIFSLAINPFNPNVIFAGSTGDGAFKSADGGNNWTPVSIDSTVYGLLVDPDDGDIVYAGSNGDGVYKSTDGGNSFARIGSPAVGVVLSIVKSGSKLFAGTAGGGVSVSDDGGVTWTNTGVTNGMALMPVSYTHLTLPTKRI